MDITTIKDWLPIAGPVIASLCIPAILWWGTRVFATRTDLAAVHVRLDRHESRLDQGEHRFRELGEMVHETSRAAVNATAAAERAAKAADKVADMQVALATVTGKIETLTAVLDRVEKHADLLVRGHLDTGGKS